MEKTNNNNDTVEKQSCTDDKIEKQKQELISNINNLLPQATYEDLRYISVFIKSLTGAK